MALSKKDRQIVHDKFGGKCAYCGCELVKGWHVDHFEPVVRKLKFGNFGQVTSTNEFHRPENDCMENYMPSCCSCNILKGSSSLEGFRHFIQNTVNSMSKRFTQYKFAKKYGLIIETGKTVQFYYEKILKS